MKSKLALVCLTVIASATWWAGCGGSSDSGSGTKDSGTGGETGANTEGGNDSGGSDAASDAKPDAAISGAFVDIQYGTCPTFAKCDSSVIGTWKVTGGCIGADAFDSLKAQAMCNDATIASPKFQARGTVAATATLIARNTETKFSATLGLPASCTTFNGTVLTCAQVEGLLSMSGRLDTVKCADKPAAAGGCDCAITGHANESAAGDAYTTSNGVLTTNGATTRTYDYCVTGTELRYRETTNNTQLPATLTLTKQ